MGDECSLRSWGARLRNCTSPKEACLCLSHSAVQLSGSIAAGAFLLDQSKESLLLTAQYPPMMNAECEICAIPAWNFDDPLAYCIHSGKECMVPLALVSELPPSITMVAAGSGSLGKSAIIMPLVAPMSRIIGALVIVFAKENQKLNEVMCLLCEYGAAVLDVAISKSQHEYIFKNLSDDVDRLGKKRSNVNPRGEKVLVGQSEAIVTLRSLIDKISDTAVPVLITGETGTGKELVASGIHHGSNRNQNAYVKINCAALPASLLESELFGHRKGAFSGAVNDYQGILRSANGGTILLDEIGEMPIAVQAKLLRVLQEQMVRPVGDVKVYPVDIRILAATNIDLESAVASGTFRRDLYHRLAVFHLDIPPLRERIEDLPLLAAHRLTMLASRYNRMHLSIAPDAWEFLRSLSYAGNIRELFSLLERAVILTDCKCNVLTKEAFTTIESHPKNGPGSLSELVYAYESGIIQSTVDYYDGKTKAASTALGIPIRTLNHKLQKIKHVHNKSLRRCCM
jgi:transcriptional regulator with GAF, ATPase, and Fis domain